jgi:hypothetical protein
MSNVAPPGTRLGQSDVERRIQVAFAVDDEKLQGFLPPKWQSASLPPGPSEGANLIIAFRNRLQVTFHDADGKNGSEGQDRGAILTAAVRRTETQEAGIWVLHSFVANWASVPGPYRNSTQVAVSVEQRTEMYDHRQAIGVERWHLQDQDGRELSMYLRYGIGTPTRLVRESKTRGGPDPDFVRIYRTDQGIDVVRSVPNTVDRVEEFSFRNTLAEFSPVFDGREPLVSISVLPWYLRQVFL